MKPRSESRVCWPIVWLWIFSIAQYSYRYILQINDSRTSHLYRSTPGALSAIKYEIFVLFVFYALFCFLRRPVRLTQRYKTPMQITCAGLVVLAAVLLVRTAVSHGDMEETLLCALQLIPWMTSVLFVPMVVQPEHSATKTLMIFERMSFWMLFPFWLMTAILAALGIRYPALSYPGLLVRCGGIIDDPNGYACLCLLLLVLSAAHRTGAWRSRVVVYTVMLIGTVSFSGYATAVVMFLCWLLLRLARPGIRHGLRIARVGVLCVMALSMVPLLSTMYNINDAAEDIASLYSAKSRSATSHLSDLRPNESMLENSSLVDLLCGTGGFSENLYWRVLANFGLAGLMTVTVLALFWSYYALWRIKRWSHSIGLWAAGFLVGSNGIAYLLTFPLSLIFWSALGLLLCTEMRDDEDARTASANIFRTPYAPIQWRRASLNSAVPIAAKSSSHGFVE
ncbi:MAG: hypothetical protein ACRD4O_08775 [Bryobacteraceae bacterium]